MHLEFVVVGVPISNQSAGSPALVAWRASVEAEAKKSWAKPPLTGKLKARIINFHAGEKTVPRSRQHVQANSGCVAGNRVR